MIVASNGAHSISPDDLTRLAEVTGIPVFTEEAARVIIPNYHQQVQLYGKAVSTELPLARSDKLAEALGAHGEYVDQPDHLQRAFATKGPSVVNVQTAPSSSPRTQHTINLKDKA
jgi:thiamine pyrophosphate-dependent acetolactate synthase large subunit-like protein